MTADEKKVLSAIFEKARNAGVAFAPTKSGDAMVSATPKDNLVESIDEGLWAQIEKELDEGDGKELAGDFCSVRSSCALCVNSFLPIRRHLSEVDVLGLGNFNSCRFEKKLTTGLNHKGKDVCANLDVYFEREDAILGFESKYTETFGVQKEPNKNNNLKPYKDNFSKTQLPQSFCADVIDYYIKKDKMRLDVSQLIKHSIALLREEIATGKKPTLVYIYWTAEGYTQADEVKKEADEFAKVITKYLNFISITYDDFWARYQNYEVLKESIEKLIARYKL